MGRGPLFRIDHARWGRIGAAMTVVGLTAACERGPDLDPPATIQIVCTSTSTSTSTSAPSTAAESVVLILDTGDGGVRWANGPAAPTGLLRVEEHQYVLDFSGDEARPWRATVNRFDGTMVRDVGKDGPTRTRDRLVCKRETEGPKL